MKNSIRTGIAVLTLTGAAALAPISTAGADPTVTASSGGVSITESGGISQGQAVDIVGTGCYVEGVPTYSGEFVSGAGDPLSNEAFQPYETQNELDGSFAWSFNVPEDNGVGTAYARWYCSSEPATTLAGPKLWVGPLVTMTMSAGEAPNRTTALRTTSAARTSKASASKTATTSGVTMTMTTDPDALPAVDLLGITGDKAAKLKAKVDAQYAKDSKGLVLLKKLLGRNAEIGKFLDGELQKQYVNTSASVLGAKKLPGKATKAYADRLAAGEIRVAIVEDIALTVKPASWYNAR